ncbi:MAG: arginine N-succinyltransferase [Xanthomonadaceae bacterium]|nr:arginine N-succinyltransferase [Xanthomonadaceae bacterium]
MILIREIEKKDISYLSKVSQIPGFINIPNDDDLLIEKIQTSIDSFKAKAPGFHGKYVFVAEDLDQKQVIGTSMVAGQHGTEESPHFYFEVGVEKKYSKTINTGFIHGTLKLEQMTNGPSELGGLILDEEFRKHESKIGRQLSFVRFLYMAMNRERFKERVIAELLPPLNKKGQSPLWEAVGRRFTNMDYWEADQLCQKNKEFILALFPKTKVYTSFLPAEARNAIGKVSKNTEPVQKMLTRIGFKYTDQVDPFDGGPHLWADVSELMPIKAFKKLQWSGAAQPTSDQASSFLITSYPASHPFKALSLIGEVDGDQFVYHGTESEAKKIEKELGINTNSTLGVIPYE